MHWSLRVGMPYPRKAPVQVITRSIVPPILRTVHGLHVFRGNGFAPGFCCRRTSQRQDIKVMVMSYKLYLEVPDYPPDACKPKNNNRNINFLLGPWLYRDVDINIDIDINIDDAFPALRSTVAQRLA